MKTLVLVQMLLVVLACVADELNVQALSDAPCAQDAAVSCDEAVSGRLLGSANN